MLYKEIEFKRFNDRGDLIPIEFGSDYANADVPFDVKRCFFISNLSKNGELVRGKHAHRDVKQVIVAVNGSFTLDLDNGKGNKESILMHDPTKGIFMDTLIWGELRDFSEDCVIYVMASDHYIPSEYIHDYDAFVELAQGS